VGIARDNLALLVYISLFLVVLFSGIGVPRERPTLSKSITSRAFLAAF